MEKHLNVIMPCEHFSPMIRLAPEVHHRVAGIQHHLRSRSFRGLDINWPCFVLREIERQADLAGVAVAMSGQSFAMSVDPPIGVGRQHGLAA